MNFLDLCKNRYSVRSFLDKGVEEEKVRAILEAGRLAPTAKNCQSHKIFVLQQEDSLARIRRATKMTYDAPLVLMVCFDKAQSYKNAADTRFKGGYDGGEVDAAIVTTEMMLQATALQLGTLWARGFNSQDIYDAFPEIAGLELVCLLAIGYPSAASAPSPRHTERKPLSETVVRL